MNNSAVSVAAEVEEEFTSAYYRAMIMALPGRLRRTSKTLLPLSEVRSRILIRGQHDRGLRSVSLDQIVGSEGRAREFDGKFRPLTLTTKDRWKRVVEAHYRAKGLPPVELFKLGDAYFVRDGNHRVSVARHMKQYAIDAHVVELDTDVTVQPRLTLGDLEYLEEQSDFLEWTNLAQVRPNVTIQVSELGGYLELIRMINQHRKALAAQQDRAVSRDEATASWYDKLYQPVVAALRSLAVATCGSGRTEADLFLKIMQLAEQQAAAGTPIDPVVLAQRLANRRAFSSRWERFWHMLTRRRA